MAASEPKPHQGGEKVRFPWKKTASEEYEGNPELKKDDVVAIRDWMKSTQYLPTVDDEMICHFLSACLYDVDKSKKAIDYFYTSRIKTPKFYTNLDPTSQELQYTINSVLLLAPLPELDKDGNRMFVFKYREGSLENFNYVDTCRWMMMGTFYNMWHNDTNTGIISIMDARDMCMSHFLKSPYGDIRDFSNIGKYGMPLRLVKFICINTNPLVKKVVSIFKSFLSKQLADTMSVHTDPESYFSGMPKDNVPEDYGGSAPDIETLHRNYIKSIEEHKEYILAEAEVRPLDTKKSAKSKNTNVVESLQTLEID